MTTDDYDANGNTISSGGISYGYDFENRLLMRGAVSIVYDGDGNRVSETAGGVTTKYLVDTLNPTGYSQLVDETVNGAVTRTYAYGLQRVSENQFVSSTWTPSFYGYDGHGNVRFLANTAGTVTDTYQYDAFGMPITSSGTTANNYRYSGEWLDGNVGLYHLRARYYNQATGRFWTRDPADRQGSPDSSSGVNESWMLSGSTTAAHIAVKIQALASATGTNVTAPRVRFNFLLLACRSAERTRAGANGPVSHEY